MSKEKFENIMKGLRIKVGTIALAAGLAVTAPVSTFAKSNKAESPREGNSIVTMNNESILFDVTNEEEVRYAAERIYEEIKPMLEAENDPCLNAIATIENIEDMIKSPKLREYRCKTQYPTSETKNSKRILAGYYREESHNITNIKFCPAQSGIINEIVEYIRENWKLGAYVEKTKKGLLKHIVIKQSSTTDEILLILVLNAKNKVDISDFANNIKEKFKNIKGILINYNPSEGNRILSDKTELVLGDNYYTEQFDDKKLKIGAESFFQVNPFCAYELFSSIKKLVKKNSSILDCYGGVGAIGSFLSDLTKSTVLIEINPEACILAEENYRVNSVRDFEILKGDVKDVISKDKTFDYSIIDPPRKGCDREVLFVLSKISKNIIYVSCNPQTLSRDIKILQEKEFKLKYVKPFDMFPYTYHMETLCMLERE